MATELEQRVLDAVTAQNEGGGAAPEGYGLSGAMKWMRWLVDLNGPGGSPRWEGGYVCDCGQVFARTVSDGGMPSALLAYVIHAGLS